MSSASDWRPRRSDLFCGIALALIATCPRPLAAQSEDITTHFAIDDDDPESSVPTSDQALRRPLDMGYQLMLLSERAEAATGRGDPLGAAKYWRAVAKAVPQSALAFSKLCRAYAAAGDSARALESCRLALGKPGVTLDDSQRFVKLLLEQPAPLTPSDVADVTAIGEHIGREVAGAAGQIAANRVRCQLASRLGDVKGLAQCTAALQRLAPDDPQTLVLAWSLAVKRGELERAKALLDRAPALNVPTSAIERMAGVVADAYSRRPWWQRWRERLPLPAAIGACLVVTLLSMTFLRRRPRIGAA